MSKGTNSKFRPSAGTPFLLTAALLCAALVSSSPLRAETGWGGGGGQGGGAVVTPDPPENYNAGQFSPWPMARIDRIGTTIDQLVSVSDLIQGIKDDRAAEKALTDNKEDTVKVFLTDIPLLGHPVLLPKSAIMSALKADEDSKADALRKLGVK